MPETYRDTDDPREALRDLLAFSSRDWAAVKGDAWLWGIVFGWDSDDVDPDGEAMSELAAKHGWDDHDVARLRRLHANFDRLTLPIEPEDSWECGACGKQTHVTHFRTGTDGSMVHAPESHEPYPGGAMSTHTPITMPMYAESGCSTEDCDHQVECPTFDAVVCLDCNAAAQGSAEPDNWEGPVASCPIFGTGVPQEQADALIGALTVPAHADGSRADG